MKGVILAGGLGTRLQPMTRVTNKHLLPVFDRPMIYFPLQQLVAAGLTEILIVTGGDSAGDFLKLLGNGREFGLKHLDYTYQEGEGGIAEALALAEHFSDGKPLCVILGDNIFQDSLAPFIREYRERGEGAMVLLKEVEDAHRFGVVEFDGDRLVRIVEKPTAPPSNLAVTGCYFLDSQVFDIVRGLTRSERGELEITDVNNAYVARSEMEYRVLKGWWTDAGTIPSLYRAAELVAGDQGNPALNP
ncbi:sugar phosphate nucleotidyltransferase [Gemmatimonadota bacterium]